MSFETIALAALGLFVAGVLKGATGLGYSTCALPFLVVSVGLRNAVVLLVAPAMASNLAVMWGAGNLRETLYRFRILYVALIPGIGYGLALLVLVDQAVATQALGALTVCYAAFALARPEIALSPRLELPLQLPVGVVNGVLTGLTGSQVMPLLPYMVSLRLEPDRFVQAVNLAVTVASGIMALGLILAGLMTWTLAGLSILGIMPAFAGVQLGNGIRRKIPDRSFRSLVLLTLGLMGVSLLAPFGQILSGVRAGP
jgi:uncharacterized membrane protein YfcA